MLYFKEIVGLRIYLALWVAVGHALQLSGFLERSNPLLKLLLDGHAAVIVFMIVSGFVITHLILTKHEPYPRYIVRRFFRLFPAYIICCAIGLLLTGAWAEIAREAPWQGVSGWPAYARSIYELEAEATDNFVPHAALHMVMLHGLVPTEVLNRAAMTFLPAAWSISLEWQFYLVAPLVIGALGRSWRMAAVTTAAVVVLYLYQRGTLGTYQVSASLAGASFYFAIGIASRLACGTLSRMAVSPVLASAVAVFAVLGLASEPLPLIVWAIFYSFMLWHAHAPLLGGWFERLTTSGPAMLFGEASYSLYLVHRPVQVALAWASLQLWTMNRGSMLGVELLAIALALLISLLLFHYVERPGMRLGWTLSNRLPGGVPQPAAALAVAPPSA